MFNLLLSVLGVIFYVYFLDELQARYKREAKWEFSSVSKHLLRISWTVQSDFKLLFPNFHFILHLGFNQIVECEVGF